MTPDSMTSSHGLCRLNAYFPSCDISLWFLDRLPKMVLVDLVFHYGGKWIREPKLLYERKLVHKWEGYDSDLLSYIDITSEYINILGYVGVQQLVVSVPSGKYYEIEGDEGIRTLLSFVNDKFDFNQNSEEVITWAAWMTLT
ncbi:hypothetical protein KY290_003562 [Solanum tuberosum]|uniref:PB1-like domain-containing protein n=1 Tax=Solanum tuberosum TaxID=4113 RepID=A0ABQ7WTA4_SOLTU|nr:hypothetical protein KY284_003704 [Solanum tuberosum]KAH0767685.1 hypothetical protein KY285_003556 [Solanum tuberosum]KAH0783964.1 hypothetical protein KY290_003562 [Solanum tuberosum]